MPDASDACGVGLSLSCASVFASFFPRAVLDGQPEVGVEGRNVMPGRNEILSIVVYGSFSGGDFLDYNSINERDSSNDLGDQLGAIEQPTFWEADCISL